VSTTYSSISQGSSTGQMWQAWNQGTMVEGTRQRFVPCSRKKAKSMAMSYGHLGAPSAWGKLPLNGSSSNSVVSSEMARHMISLYFCKVCNVQCSDEFKFEEHRRGKKHRGKVWKQKVMTFCNVCKVQCNSEQMLANHLTGKKHQKNASLMGLI